MSDLKHATYRPDIDGLRAIAVILVLLFHAFPSLVPGGFIGVDIFFVISGYLITGIIIKELESENFKFSVFYARRARRILPALIVVLIFSLISGTFLLTPPELSQLIHQVVASTFFSANILFWMEAGYFDPEAITKPLLHIWSLGVEEQFYFLWPFLLYLAAKKGKKFGQLALGVSFISMFINIYLMEHHRAASFFLPIPRLWQLSLGAFLAASKFEWIRRTYANVAATTGLALIFFGAFFLNDQSNFPGWLALIPTAGAALIISAKERAFFNSSVLATPVLLFIGLISYPLYLWHWPILSFLHTVAGGVPTAPVRLAALAASALLSWITFVILEKPVRRQQPHVAFRWLGAGLAGVLLSSLLIEYHGTHDRNEIVVANTESQPTNKDAENPSSSNAPKLSSTTDHTTPEQERSTEMSDLSTATMGAGFEWRIRGCGVPQNIDADIRDCFTDSREPPRYAVWGDSHANALMPGLLRESSPGARWVQVGAGGCPPMSGGIRRVYPGDPGYDTPVICSKANKIALEMLRTSTTVKAVVFVTASRMVTPPIYSSSPSVPPYENAIVEGMSAAANQLHQAGKVVYLLIDNPSLPNPKDCIKRKISVSSMEEKNCFISLEQHLTHNQTYLELIQRISKASPFIKIVDPTMELCPNKVCSISLNNKFLYTDGDHLSDTGNGTVARYLIKNMVKDAL